eukprot:3917709-Rhodomonas_salina.5
MLGADVAYRGTSSGMTTLIISVSRHQFGYDGRGLGPTGCELPGKPRPTRATHSLVLTQRMALLGPVRCVGLTSRMVLPGACEPIDLQETEQCLQGPETCSFVSAVACPASSFFRQSRTDTRQKALGRPRTNAADGFLCCFAPAKAHSCGHKSVWRYQTAAPS